MTFAGTFKSFWEEQSNLFRANLFVIRKRPTHKAVHDIRVSIKKLKSCVLLTAVILQKSAPWRFELITRFFRVTGKFRDVENSLMLIDRYRRNTGNRVEALEIHLKASRSLTRTMIRDVAELPLDEELASFRDQVFTELDQIPDHLAGERALERTRELYQGTLSLVPAFEKEAHEIRKRLKRCYYWLGLLPEHSLMDKKQIKGLDRILTALGNWHDHFVLHEKARSFRKEFLVKGTPDHSRILVLEKFNQQDQQERLREAREWLDQLNHTLLLNS